MSEAEQRMDRRMAMAERLAEMDLAAAEHVHAQLLATTEPKAVAELGRTYQRLSRCLRQSLMLCAKVDKDCAQAAEYAERSKPQPYVPDARQRLTDGRIEDLQDAIGRIAAVTYPGNLKLQREALDRLDIELDEWPDDDDFLTERLTTLIDQACERLGLPRRYSDTWEDLPKPANPFDPATKPQPAAATPAPPKADTG
jgi:hypothetical protein